MPEKEVSGLSRLSIGIKSTIVIPLLNPKSVINNRLINRAGGKQKRKLLI
jgi:hypothetical protein